MQPLAPQPPVVLITRPLHAAQRFAAQIADLALPVVIAPLLRIVPVPHDPKAVAAAEGLVLTSENAVPHAGAGRGRPAICVGPRTAELARAAGFAVTEGPGDAAGMMPLLSGLGPGWLHLRGVRVVTSLPVRGLIVYDQQALPLTDDATALLRRPGTVILPLFSPRSARLAAEAAGAAGASARLAIAAISAAAAAEWDATEDAPPVALRAIASHPDAPAMRAEIARLAAEQSGPARVEQDDGAV